MRQNESLLIILNIYTEENLFLLQSAPNMCACPEKSIALVYMLTVMP